MLKKHCFSTLIRIRTSSSNSSWACKNHLRRFNVLFSIFVFKTTDASFYWKPWAYFRAVVGIRFCLVLLTVKEIGKTLKEFYPLCVKIIPLESCFWVLPCLFLRRNVFFNLRIFYFRKYAYPYLVFLRRFVFQIRFIRFSNIFWRIRILWTRNKISSWVIPFYSNPSSSHTPPFRV